MPSLKELLQAAADETRFDLGRIESTPTASRSIFPADPNNLATPSELRDLLAHRPYHDQDVLRATGAQMIVSDEMLSQLTNHLETMMQDFIDPATNRIGHAFPIASTVRSAMTLEMDGILCYHGLSRVIDLAKAFVRGATILGAESMSQLVEGWIQGEGVVFHTRALLNGAALLTQRLEPIEGVRIEPLPLSTDQLTGYLPHRTEIEPSDYLGRTILSIEHKVEPTLYLPSDDLLANISRETEIPGIEFSTVCDALALETDAYADVAFFWNDYLTLEACAPRGTNRAWSAGPSRLRPRLHANYSLHTNHPSKVATLDVSYNATLLIEEQSLRAAIAGLAARKSERARIAAARWASSKDSWSSLADSFIDLRIALESLYLPDSNDKYRGEKRFRQALYGAWHLGFDVAERQRIRKVLRDAYDTASAAVHDGHVDSTSENQELLKEAQDLCRQGLLKMLRDGPPEDWWELILGGGIPAEPT